MNTIALQKALEASRRLGIPCIVVLEDIPVVVMDIDAYAQTKTMNVRPVSEYVEHVKKQDNIEGLTEEELFDKINRDIASWRSANQTEELASPLEIPQETQGELKNEQPAAVAHEQVVEDQFYIEPVE